MNEELRQWNDAAEAFAASQEQSEYAIRNKAAVTARFPDLSGTRFLDLGCGYGWYTEYFRTVGAAVQGIDGSAAMIRIARQRYPRCRFDVADITCPLPFPDSAFQLVFCNQVLMDIGDVESVLDETTRVLEDGSLLYASIVHPAFFDCEWLQDDTGYRYAKAMRSYLSCYRFTHTFWGDTSHFHRPLSWYLNLAADAGFRLRHAEEPVSYDGARKNRDLPLFLMMEWEKAVPTLIPADQICPKSSCTSSGSTSKNSSN